MSALRKTPSLIRRIPERHMARAMRWVAVLTIGIAIGFLWAQRYPLCEFAIEHSMAG